MFFIIKKRKEKEALQRKSRNIIGFYRWWRITTSKKKKKKSKQTNQSRVHNKYMHEQLIISRQVISHNLSRFLLHGCFPVSMWNLHLSSSPAASIPHSATLVKVTGLSDNVIQCILVGTVWCNTPRWLGGTF